jgi:hypothetical protein
MRLANRWTTFVGRPPPHFSYRSSPPAPFTRHGSPSCSSWFNAETMESKAPLRDQIREYLLREKRLLLAVSVILLAHQLLGITISSSAETMGLRFEIEKPERLFVGIWLVWLWALLRYLQLLYSLRPRADFPDGRRTETFHAICDWIAFKKAKRQAQKAFDAQVPRKLQLGLLVARGGKSGFSGTAGNKPLNNKWLVVRITRRWRDPQLPDPPPEVQPFAQSHKRVDSIADGVHEIEDHLQVPLDFLERNVFISYLATAWTLTATSFVTEYYLPLAIGLAPLLIAATRVARDMVPSLLGY